jgi:hypothetical protein
MLIKNEFEFEEAPAAGRRRRRRRGRRGRRGRNDI